jgi:competence protein ComEC
VLFLAAWTLGVGCFSFHERTWQREKEALVSGEELLLSAQVVYKEEKSTGWELLLSLPGYENRLLLSIDEESVPIGSVLSVKGKIREFQSPRNEGQFNEAQYYKCKKIVGRISASDVRVVKDTRTSAWREGLYHIKQGLCAVYRSCLSEQEAGILCAITTGNKTSLTDSAKKLFQTAGISHILAISGMHISLLGLGCYGILSRLGLRRFPGAGLTMGFLLAFLLLIGQGTSARRAIGMFGLLLLAKCIGRGYDLWSALAVVCVVLLAGNPFLLWEGSFQLSFLAVTAVCLFDEFFPSHLKSRAGKLFQSVCFALFLQLFTMPLVAWQYYELPVYGLVGNLLLVPLVGFLLGLGLLGGTAGLLWLPLGRVILVPCRLLCLFYLTVCGMVAKLPHALIICGQPSVKKVLAAYALLLLGWYLLHALKAEGRGMGIVALTGCAYAFFLTGQVSGFEIDYLDVGQGDGSMLCTGGGQVCFVDGGSSDVSGVGTYRILPFLKAKGIQRVDYWMLSHLDEDHVSGFYEVLESGYPIGAVLVASAPEDEARRQLVEELEAYGVPLVSVCAGQTLPLENAGTFYFLSPNQDTPADDSNGYSLVCRYEENGIRALWTGDMGSAQEQWLLEQGGVKSVDIYKAAHHGSAYSNSEAFLQALRPKACVISCGKNNVYGHPSPDAVERMEATGSQLFYTMEGGRIRFFCEDGKLMADCYVGE